VEERPFEGRVRIELDGGLQALFDYILPVGVMSRSAAEITAMPADR
jgi:hypothetical protein